MHFVPVQVLEHSRAVTFGSTGQPFMTPRICGELYLAHHPGRPRLRRLQAIQVRPTRWRSPCHY